METISHTLPNGKTDTFEVINAFPDGYIIWNIGRENHPFPKHIPLAQPGYKGNPHCVYPDTLKSLEVESEELALYLLKRAQQRTIRRNRFYTLVHIFKNINKNG